MNELSLSERDPERLARLLDLMAHDPANLSLRKTVIREALEVGNWDVADDLVTIGLLSAPVDGELLAHQGLVRIYAQRFEEAEKSLLAALAYGVTAAAPRYNLAFARIMLDRHEDALSLLTPDVVAAVPSARMLRARCFYHLEHVTEAARECEQHLAEVPDDAECQGLLALLIHEQGDSPRARGLAQAALARNPVQIEALLALALVQFAAGEVDLARAVFDRLLQVQPSCGRGFLGRGQLELSINAVEAARRDLECAARYLPTHVGTWHALAWACLLLSDLQAADAAFHQALRLDRNFAETHGGLAVVAALKNDTQEARLHLKRAVRLNTLCLSARCAEVLLLHAEGDRAGAAAVFSDFLERRVAGTPITYRELLSEHLQKRLEIPLAGEGTAIH